MDHSEYPVQWEVEADIVVVGGGGAGFSAAVSAAQSGMRVVLLEKAGRVGGTTALAVGSIAAAGTSLQQRVGICDSPTLHLNDVARIVANRPGTENVELRRVLIEAAPQAVEWLRRLGVEFYGPMPAAGSSQPRLHNAIPNARAYIAVLSRAARRLGVAVHTGVRVTRLHRDSNGRVSGVLGVRDQDQSHCAFRARRAVILATGYFHANEAMRAQYMSPQASQVDSLIAGQTGDGHLLAMQAGAELVNMGVGSHPEFRFVAPASRGVVDRLPINPWLLKALWWASTWIPKWLFLPMVKGLLIAHTAPSPRLFDEGAILVNSEGRRFVNELEPFEYSVASQPGKAAYLLFDQQVAARYARWPNYVSTAPGIAYAYLPDYRRLRPDIYRRGANLGELAQAVGISANGLCDTVQAYNCSVEAGCDRDYGRQQLGGGIRVPPFHLMGPAKSYFVDSQGGPAVNTRCQVLHDSGQAIPGLYAVGALAKGGLLYGGAGSDLAWAFTSGRLAAQYAAEEAALGLRGAGE
jgi:fumarate reductase flavoprotein subunit